MMVSLSANYRQFLKVRFLTLATFCFLLLLNVSCGLEEDNSGRVQSDKHVAPDFRARDITDWQTFRQLSDYQGSHVVLFWVGK
jgi:hypothetical protein